MCAYHQTTESNKQIGNLKNHNPHRFQNRIQVLKPLKNRILGCPLTLRMKAVFERS
jgi:hypothetical protein